MRMRELLGVIAMLPMASAISACGLLAPPITCIGADTDCQDALDHAISVLPPDVDPDELIRARIEILDPEGDGLDIVADIELVYPDALRGEVPYQVIVRRAAAGEPWEGIIRTQ